MTRDTPPQKVSPLNDSLLAAATNGDTDAALDLIKRGAQINAVDGTGWTALHAAAWAGHTDTVNTLIANGADIHARDHNEWTPLHWAAHMGRKDAAKALLEHDATLPRAVDNKGMTPLHRAATGGHTGLIILLVEAGADLDAQDAAGKTPLDIADKSGWKDTALKLREIISLRNARRTMRLRHPHAPGP